MQPTAQAAGNENGFEGRGFSRAESAFLNKKGFSP